VLAAAVMVSPQFKAWLGESHGVPVVRSRVGRQTEREYECGQSHWKYAG
jgi:hypothetical protein